MSFCANCIKGVIHEGTSTGNIVEIDGVKCYVATPTVDYPKDKVLLFLTDVFGLPLVNNQLLADAYALNGFKTVMPDLFSGHPIPENALMPNTQPPFDLMKWFGTKDDPTGHTQVQTRPIIDKVIAALKNGKFPGVDKVTSIGAVGYCFGGRYVFDLAFDSGDDDKSKNAISSAAVAHPSLLNIPDDLHKYAVTSKVPLLINSCTTDGQFPPEAGEKADKIIGEAENFKGTESEPARYKREHFKGCEHGFAVRGDLSNPAIKAGKEGAFKATVEWMIKYM
ncbi:hypothetical protein C8R44DRAFT_796298 [Mycena epipterygia]|nr:hypothetical protein C8R44DRAFT_796298 [Mycena epipterygia]